MGRILAVVAVLGTVGFANPAAAQVPASCQTAYRELSWIPGVASLAWQATHYAAGSGSLVENLAQGIRGLAGVGGATASLGSRISSVLVPGLAVAGAAYGVYLAVSTDTNPNAPLINKVSYTVAAATGVAAAVLPPPFGTIAGAVSLAAFTAPMWFPAVSNFFGGLFGHPSPPPRPDLSALTGCGANLGLLSLSRFEPAMAAAPAASRRPGAVLAP